MREIELKIISQLLTNSQISDRELAKKLGVSQPTVTRLRHKLEDEGYIKGYAVMPDLQKLGYQIVATTFVKFRKNLMRDEEERLRKRAEEKFKDVSYASNVVMFERGMGFGYTGVLVSYHEDYASYAKFMQMIKQLPVLETDVVSFIIDVNDQVQYRPLSFAPLAHHIMTLKQKDSK